MVFSTAFGSNSSIIVRGANRISRSIGGAKYGEFPGVIQVWFSRNIFCFVSEVKLIVKLWMIFFQIHTIVSNMIQSLFGSSTSLFWQWTSWTKTLIDFCLPVENLDIFLDIFLDEYLILFSWIFFSLMLFTFWNSVGIFFNLAT